MSINKSYYDIFNINATQFRLTKKNSKSKNALAILHNIETLIATKKKNIDQPTQSEQETFQELQKIAQEVSDGFKRKAKGLNFLRRFFGQVSQVEAKVDYAFSRIKNAICLPCMLPNLPKVCSKKVVEFLSIKDQISCAQVNKEACEHVQKTKIQLAQQFGYVGNNKAEAQKYLEELYRFIHCFLQIDLYDPSFSCRFSSTLIRYYPKKIISFYIKKNFLQTSRVNYEQTLRNLENLTVPEMAFILVFSNQYGFSSSSIEKYILKLVKDGKIKPKTCLSKELILDGFFRTYHNEKIFLEILVRLTAVNNVKDSWGQKAMQFAINNDFFECINLFLTQGYDVNSSMVPGQPLLCYAIKNRASKRCIQLLVSSGANINVTQGDSTPLIFAIVHNRDSSIVKLLLEAGALVNQLERIGNNNNQFSPLMYAVQTGNKELVELLLNYGADPKIKGSNGQSVLTVGNTKVEILDLLIKSGHMTDINDFLTK